MPLSSETRESLLNYRQESLNLEMKTTLDPRTAEGQAKLVKAVHAIFNRNGGFLLVGFGNAGDPTPLDDDILTQFNQDNIQSIISRHSSPPIEIELDFLQVDSNMFPVVIVPPGVRVPTVVKKGLTDRSDGTTYLSTGDVYFRTLAANGTPSSARFQTTDFGDLLDVCFRNRGTEIVQFLRGIRADTGPEERPQLSDNKIASEALAHFERHFKAELVASPLLEGREWLLDALTLTVAVVPLKMLEAKIATEELLNRVRSSNPNYTGWPVWLDSRGFGDASTRPRVTQGGWTSLFNRDSWDGRPELEIIRIEPSGRLFLRRVLQDDLVGKRPKGAVLDPLLLTHRIVEIIAAGTSILRGIGISDNTDAVFVFEWKGLAGRRLDAWSEFSAYFSNRISHDDEVVSVVRVPVRTLPWDVGSYVAEALAPLFALFGGFEMPQATIDRMVKRVVGARPS